MKKILHVVVKPQMAGSQQIAYDILRKLPSDYDKYILCSGPIPDDFRKQFEQNHISIIELKNLNRDISKKDIIAFYELYRFFKKNRFDIIHTNATKPGILARIAARLAGNRNILHTVHGVAFHKFVSFPKRIVFYSLELFACLFGTLNITVNNNYLKYYPRYLTKTICIYNGVDFETFKTVEPKKRTHVNVAFFARLDEQKAPLVFIEIVKKLVLDYELKNVRFIIGGNGELLPQCLQLISDYSLKNHIELTGWVDDKSAFLNEIDVIVQPSHWEAFGLNIVEAAHFSIPAVTSNVEGLPEVVVDGKTGFTCEVDDIDAFSDKIALLVNDPKLRTQMGQNARKYVHERFDIQKMYNQYFDIYEKISNDK